MRKVGVAVALAAAAAFAADVAQAQDAGAPAPTMTCERVDAPGRVRCEVEAHAAAGESITWGDVVIAATPGFVGALRGRIGPHDATTHDPDVWRWALALVAREKGSGDVQARVRLVVCRQDKCSPRELPVTGRVEVGPSGS